MNDIKRKLIWAAGGVSVSVRENIIRSEMKNMLKVT